MLDGLMDTSLRCSHAKLKDFHFQLNHNAHKPLSAMQMGYSNGSHGSKQPRARTGIAYEAEEW